MHRRTIVLTLALVLLLPWPALAQSTKLPAVVDLIVRELYERNKPLAHGNDDQRRALTKKVAEQVTCELGPNWGWKSASSTRPPSKDAIARHGGDPRSGPLDGWDLFNGSTRQPIVGGIHHDLSKPPRQHFIAVAAVDHLGTGCLSPAPPPPPAEPPPGPNPSELQAILEELRLMRAELKAAIEKLQGEVEKGVKIRF